MIAAKSVVQRVGFIPLGLLLLPLLNAFANDGSCSDGDDSLMSLGGIHFNGLLQKTLKPPKEIEMCRSAK